jgi:hypothetical protein
MTFDENNPVEQNAIVFLKNNTGKGYFYVKTYNGISIREAVYKGKYGSSIDKVRLTIPAGNTSLTLDVRYTISSRYYDVTYKYDDVTFQYNFEAGKKYLFKGRRKLVGLIKGYDFFVGLYDVTQKSLLLSEWQLQEAK